MSTQKLKTGAEHVLVLRDTHTERRAPESQLDGELDAVRAGIAGLLAGSARPPARIRVQAGSVVVELEWPDPAAAAAAPGRDGLAPAAAAATEAPAASTAPTPAAPPAHTVRAATVGVFYHAPSPGAPPFVRPGDIVAPGQQLGIVEAMKLMLPVEADVAGRVIDVLAADGAQVEYDEPLISLAPTDEAGGD